MTRLLLALLLGATALSAAAQEKKLIPVTMTLNWFPQAEHGGYFAALVEKIYEKHGLDVTLKPGGPQVNIHQLLAAGQTGRKAHAPAVSSTARPALSDMRRSSRRDFFEPTGIVQSGAPAR